MSMHLYYSLIYPACKEHHLYAALYCHVKPVWLYHNFPHYLINSTIFRKRNVLNIKYKEHVEYPLFLSDFSKLEFFY